MIFLYLLFSFFDCRLKEQSNEIQFFFIQASAQRQRHLKDSCSWPVQPAAESPESGPEPEQHRDHRGGSVRRGQQHRRHVSKNRIFLTSELAPK